MDARKLARTQWLADSARYADRQEAARKAGEVLDEAGPPPTGFTLLPWLLLGTGACSNLFQGETPNPWIGGLGLITFNSLYINVVFRAFRKDQREATSTRVWLALVTCGLALGYGGDWLLFFPLLGLATGAVMRGPLLGRTGLALATVAGVVSGVREGTNAINIVYATLLSTMVTAALLPAATSSRVPTSAGVTPPTRECAGFLDRRPGGDAGGWAGHPRMFSAPT
ncbi:hypothetical protein [Streptomyces sp. TRM68367]|uniref:hypothetical protein n=1 Tax=Streptomyces sp. TRM68367 TaxID=2758415 RepID=UPI00165BE73E|nr:hypothetical protein [Streptomyces sp. TRM68367]MBC9724060.1 hypothetical protein [Streptomyces sp. TRM68367]